MNGHWNRYCAYTESGRFKGAAHSTAAFRKAFARVYLLLHGGTAVQLNARLRALGLPAVTHDYDVNPTPVLRVVWNPQGYGSPNLPGNSAQAYYPGNRYVDVVANDLYDIDGKAEWAANDRLYRAHPAKLYAIAEWGLWGIDDPAFVRRMGGWARTHRRLIRSRGSRANARLHLRSREQARQPSGVPALHHAARLTHVCPVQAQGVACDADQRGRAGFAGTAVVSRPAIRPGGS